jgi:hypothetical protein
MSRPSATCPGSGRTRPRPWISRISMAWSSNSRSSLKSPLARCVPTPSTVTPSALQQPAEVRDHQHDADRAGDRGRVRPHFVRGQRHHVPARGRHAAHRDDHGLARRAHQLELAHDGLGGQLAAAAAVHAQHQRPERRRPRAPCATARAANRRRWSRAAAPRAGCRRARRSARPQAWPPAACARQAVPA